ncbi:DNA/RNA non-specific endonuclease [Janibacter anophelis]|uniref:DNA/RNA non-specific endonuclease n=1 Tax=Janibacter anophelis TaxID=319054 RepID=UPI0008361D17|nr:DNA/RNA non-specific endonuclease [Janibacter anophelis]
MSTGVTHGADTDRLRAVAQDLSGSARTLLQVQHAGASSMGVLVEAWAGADTEVFAADWQRSEPLLAAAAERLSTLARLLVEQAEEQDQASREGSRSGAPGTVDRPLDMQDALRALGFPLTSPRAPWVNASTALPPSMPFADNPVSRWVADVRKKFGRVGIPMPPPPGEVLDGANDWWQREVIFTDKGADALDALDGAADFVDSVPDRLGYFQYLPPILPATQWGYPALAEEMRSWGDMAQDPKGYWTKELSNPVGQATAGATLLMGPLGRLAGRHLDELVDRLPNPYRHPDKINQIGSYEIPRDAIRVDSGKKFNWNKELNNPQPDSTYVVDNRFVYVTDEHGRVKEAHGVLTDEPGHRNGYQQRKAGGDDRLPGDQGGHIYGKGVGGPGEGINLLAMSKQANQGDYARIERQWRTLLKEHPPPVIESKIIPVYSGDSKRPDRFMVEWTKNGEMQPRELIKNK